MFQGLYSCSILQYIQRRVSRITNSCGGAVPCVSYRDPHPPYFSRLALALEFLHPLVLALASPTLNFQRVLLHLLDPVVRGWSTFASQRTVMLRSFWFLYRPFTPLKLPFQVFFFPPAVPDPPGWLKCEFQYVDGIGGHCLSRKRRPPTLLSPPTSFW